MLNYYRLLGVPETATPQQIDQGYLRMRERLRRAAKDPARQAQLQEVEIGYEILANPRRRYAYDLLREKEPDEPRPRRRDAAWALLLHHARIARAVNLALLLCCLLLALDWALPLREFSHEAVLSREPVQVSSSLSDPQMAYRVMTRHTSFRLPTAIGHRVREGQHITVWRTPLLGVVRRVSSPASPDGPEPFQPYGGTIYGSFFLLPLLLMLVSGVGVLPDREPETYVNTAAVSGLLAILVLVILLWF
jgi:hypothetical protein